ncbi:hypothetical protein ADUPG1_011786, partial [Aduncisulcus paluster]
MDHQLRKSPYIKKQKRSALSKHLRQMGIVARPTKLGEYPVEKKPIHTVMKGASRLHSYQSGRKTASPRLTGFRSQSAMAVTSPSHRETTTRYDTLGLESTGLNSPEYSPARPMMGLSKHKKRLKRPDSALASLRFSSDVTRTLSVPFTVMSRGHVPTIARAKQSSGVVCPIVVDIVDKINDLCGMLGNPILYEDLLIPSEYADVLGMFGVDSVLAGISNYGFFEKDQKDLASKLTSLIKDPTIAPYTGGEEEEERIERKRIEREERKRKKEEEREEILAESIDIPQQQPSAVTSQSVTGNSPSGAGEEDDVGEKADLSGNVKIQDGDVASDSLVDWKKPRPGEEVDHTEAESHELSHPTVKIGMGSLEDTEEEEENDSEEESLPPLSVLYHYVMNTPVAASYTITNEKGKHTLTSSLPSTASVTSSSSVIGVSMASSAFLSPKVEAGTPRTRLGKAGSIKTYIRGDSDIQVAKLTLPALLRFLQLLRLQEVTASRLLSLEPRSHVKQRAMQRVVERAGIACGIPSTSVQGGVGTSKRGGVSIAEVYGRAQILLSTLQQQLNSLGERGVNRRRRDVLMAIDTKEGSRSSHATVSLPFSPGSIQPSHVLSTHPELYSSSTVATPTITPNKGSTTKRKGKKKRRRKQILVAIDDDVGAQDDTGNFSEVPRHGGSRRKAIDAIDSGNSMNLSDYEVQSTTPSSLPHIARSQGKGTKPDAETQRKIQIQREKEERLAQKREEDAVLMASEKEKMETEYKNVMKSREAKRKEELRQKKISDELAAEAARKAVEARKKREADLARIETERKEAAAKRQEEERKKKLAEKKRIEERRKQREEERKQKIAEEKRKKEEEARKAEEERKRKEKARKDRLEKEKQKREEAKKKKEEEERKKKEEEEAKARKKAAVAAALALSAGLGTEKTTPRAGQTKSEKSTKDEKDKDKTHTIASTSSTIHLDSPSISNLGGAPSASPDLLGILGSDSPSPSSPSKAKLSS